MQGALHGPAGEAHGGLAPRIQAPHPDLDPARQQGAHPVVGAHRDPVASTSGAAAQQLLVGLAPQVPADVVRVERQQHAPPLVPPDRAHAVLARADDRSHGLPRGVTLREQLADTAVVENAGEQRNRELARVHAHAGEVGARLGLGRPQQLAAAGGTEAVQGPRDALAGVHRNPEVCGDRERPGGEEAGGVRTGRRCSCRPAGSRRRVGARCHQLACSRSPRGPAGGSPLPASLAGALSAKRRGRL